MRTLTSFIALAAALAASSYARNCHANVNYCGHTLTNIGNYQGQIDQNLYDRGITGNSANMLFYCVGGDSGVIDYIEDCESQQMTCHDSGNSASDWCSTSFKGQPFKVGYSDGHIRRE